VLVPLDVLPEPPLSDDESSEEVLLKPPPIHPPEVPFAMLLLPALIEDACPCALLFIPPATVFVSVGVMDELQSMLCGFVPVPVSFEQPPRIEPRSSAAALYVPPLADAKLPEAVFWKPPVTPALLPVRARLG